MFWLILGIFAIVFITWALGAVNGIAAILAIRDMQVDDKEVLELLNKVRKSYLYKNYVKQWECKPWKN